MNHTTETVATVNTKFADCRRDQCASWLEWHEGQCAMWPVLVIVGHKHVKNAYKVLLVQNQHPVETFRASRAYKPLRRTVI